MNKNSRNFNEFLLRFLLRPDQWRHQVNPCQAFQDNRKFENIISEIFIPKNVLPNRISDTHLKVRTEIHFFYLLGFKFLKKIGWSFHQCHSKNSKLPISASKSVKKRQKASKSDLKRINQAVIWSAHKTTGCHFNRLFRKL